jgi:hypothetical protein
VTRDRDVMFAVPIGREPQVTARLPGDGVTQARPGASKDPRQTGRGAASRREHLVTNQV